MKNLKELEKYFNFIKDEDTKNTVKRVYDKVNYVKKNYNPIMTEFINPYIVGLCIPIINNNDIKLKLFPSFDYSERKVLILYPEYFEDINENDFITAIKIKNKSKFKKLTHKDYLGSIMSLGIDRSKIGDIYVNDYFADVVIHKDICDYILYNLDQIGHNKIEIQEIDLENIDYRESEHEILNIISSSLRLDSIVKNIVNKSREISCNMIKSKLIKVNFTICDKTIYQICENDIISISKYGRYRISKCNDTTKSGRFKVEVKHYI